MSLMALIVANGYDCPRIGILWAKGPSPHGTKLEAFCGPPTGTGIYEALHYAIYPEQLRVETRPRRKAVRHFANSDREYDQRYPMPVT